MTLISEKLDLTPLIGSRAASTLEERVFNAFCLICVVAMLLEVPINIAVGLYATALLCLVCALIGGGLYYLAHIKKKNVLATNCFAIAANLAFTVNYFFNSGLNGPSLMLFGLALLMSVVVMPNRQLYFWLCVNVLLVSCLLAFEYWFPNYVPNMYENDSFRFWDVGITYVVFAFLILLTVKLIRGSYNEERKLVDRQNLKISQQNELLEKTNTEKDKLFSIVAHDIKSPMASIQGYLEVLSADLSAKERELVEHNLLQLTKDASYMISNLLAWAKARMEGSEPKLGSLLVYPFINDALKVERSLAENKSINLSIHLQKDLRVWADSDMLQIVLRNLINNAIKFTPKGGCVEVVVVKEGENCIFSVKDTGAGVKPEAERFLFDLKAESTYGTGNEKGVGLGLVLCKEFVERQNGKIWYEKSVNDGSVFKFSVVSM